MFGLYLGRWNSTGALCVSDFFLSVLASICCWKSEGISLVFPWGELAVKSSSV